MKKQVEAPEAVVPKLGHKTFRMEFARVTGGWKVILTTLLDGDVVSRDEPGGIMDWGMAREKCRLESIRFLLGGKF